MIDLSLYRRIIGGEAGPWASPLRGLLHAASWCYGAGIRWRNRRYDRGVHVHDPPVPVISVGNLSIGGTGKTPFVIDLLHRLERLAPDVNPAVVARGYGAAPEEPNDEQRLIQKHCPAVAYVADADRVAATRAARQHCGADVVILDDGFQHRRLARSLDIVLIDATCPFGYGHLLPRGLLREPVASLRRADMVVLTRCDQSSRGELRRVSERVKALAPNADHLQCGHTAQGVEWLDETPLGEGIGALSGKRVVLFASIGNPKAFATTVRLAGADVVGTRWFPDHHPYRDRDLARLQNLRGFPAHDLLLTTEKDAVKLAALGSADAARIAVLKVAIDFAAGDGTILDHALMAVLSGKAAP